MLHFLRSALLCLTALFFMGCSSAEKIDTSTPEGAFKLASTYEDDERFEEAITYFSEVKNKYPYSSLAVQAELKIADIEFKRENYASAETAYKLFKEFHPTHEKIDYVTYRLGLSTSNQLPETIDRDLSLATPALEYYNEVITRFSDSKYVADSKKQRERVTKMLADKANYIAEYYFIRDKWESALGRYEDLLKNYVDMGYEASSLYGATLSAYKMKDKDKAKVYFKRLLTEHPQSKELAKAREELSDGF
jgi:outer membrane protein assembly factor BamD